MKMKCPFGHIFWITWGNFNQGGQRCHQCFIDNNKSHKYKEVKEYMEGKDYELITEEYINNSTKLEIKCPKGHIFWMNWNNFYTGHGCTYCFGTPKLTIEYVKEHIESKGHELLAKEYKDAHTKLEIKCPKGHIFWMNWNNFYTGHRCPKCCNSKSFSKGEKEVLEYVQSLTDTTIIENDRTQIINPKTDKYLELDIFLPDLMKAIEYNSTYWHSDEETKYRDNQKVLQCKEKGIDLMIIEEKDWNNNKDECKINIIEILGEI